MRNIESIYGRAAAEGSRHSRLAGAVDLLDDLAGQVSLSPSDHRFYFTAWRATRVLCALPGDLVAGRSSSVPTS